MLPECGIRSLSRPKTSDFTLVDQELSVAHDLAVVDPDVEARADDVDVRRRVPVGAGVRAVGIAERDVDAGELLVLQDVADDLRQLDVGADRELADAIGVLVGVRVLPEVVLELLVLAVRLDEPVVLDRAASAAIAARLPNCSQRIVADDAVDDERAVDVAGRREDLAARQVAPLVGADEAARLEPAVVRD